MRCVIEEEFKVAKVSRWVYKNDEGFVYGHLATVEADLKATNVKEFVKKVTLE